MRRWSICVARDLAIAAMVGGIYAAGSLMLAMLLAALLGATLDEPFSVRAQLALLVASLLVAGGILVAPRLLREEHWNGWPSLAIPQALSHLFGGLLLGAALVATTVAVLFLAGWYTPPTGQLAPMALLRALGPPLFSALVVAVTEELFERRLLFPILERSLGSWLALALGAAWFGATHRANPHASPAAAAGIALGGGLAYTLAFIATRRVWLSVGLHWGWNGALGPIFGLPVSGLDHAALGQAQVAAGADRWTGGAFGPEAGLVALLVHLPLHGALIWFILRSGRAQPPRWSCLEEQVGSS